MFTNQLGQNEKPLFHFNRAVETDIFTSTALLYRGEYYLSFKEYGLALADFEKASSKTREFYRIYKGFATAHAGLGQRKESLEFTTKCLQLNIAQTEQDIVSISTPFWESEKFYRAGIEYYQSLTELLPERWWLYHNIGGLAERLGEEEIAKEALARSEELKGRD